MWYDAYAFHGPVGDMPLDPDFKQTSMMEQFAKIVDGGSILPGIDLPEKKYNPINTVVTDDGDEFMISPKQAKAMLDIVGNIDVRDRLDALKQIQTTKGLTQLMDYVKV
jgi:hypothetical protein